MLVVCAGLAPWSAGADELGQVGKLTVEGNSRTADAVIRRATRVREGDPSWPEMVTDVQQRVFNLRLFEEVEVVPEPNGDAVDLTIRVKERWTLLPIPFFGASGRGVQGGVFVLETNLFGWNKTLALGGSYGTKGGTAFAFYRDPSVHGTDFLVRGSARYADLVREQFDGQDLAFAYRDQRFDVSLSGGYQILPWLAVYLGWYASVVDGETEPDQPAPPEGGTVHGWTAEVEVRAQDFHLYFNEGFLGRLQARQSVTALGSDRDVLELSGLMQYTSALFGDQSTSLTLQAGLTDGDAILDAILLGGQPGTRGFERLGLWAERAVTLTLEHQIPVLRFGWGIWTLNAFAEVGAVEWRDRTTRFFTPGLGFRLYLRRIAIPAVGLDVAYSTADRRVLVIANLGLSF